MQWWRSRRQIGACVALFALCLQLAVAFAHVHPEDFNSPSTAVSYSSGGQSGYASHRQDGGPAHDDCAICASIFLASTAVPASSPALASPAVYRSTLLVGIASPDFRLVRYVSFRTRAPPLA
jgi:hypothetical protein